MGDPPLCPSARADAPDAVVIGIVDGSVDEPRVRQLERPVPVTEEILASTGPVDPARVLRIAASCLDDRCRHFADQRCAFAAKVVTMLPEVTESLPACGVRARCRWFAEQGGAACRRCPQVVTQDPNPTPAMARAADPGCRLPDVATGRT